MSGGMPHHWEKGEINLLLEEQFNSGRATLWRILEQLRRSHGEENWVLDMLPGFEGHDDMRRIHGETGRGVLEHFCTHWLGKRDDVGLGEDWTPTGDRHADRTGYWISYVGDVEQIIRRTLTWAIELALGIERDAEADPEVVLDPPHRIELFNVCPFPWFEGWVVRRPVADDPERALITVCWLTPANAASRVAASPIAEAAVSAEVAHAPGVPSYQDDYEVLDPDFVHPLPDRPRVPAAHRTHASWVVTHHRHVPMLGDERQRDDDTTAASPFGEWDMPRTVYQGQGDVVIVSPSLAAGGITHDGRVPPRPQTDADDAATGAARGA